LSSSADNWRHELESAWLYERVAEIDPDAKHRDLFLKLAAAAREQAQEWARAGKADPVAMAAFEPSMRARLVARLVRRFGARSLRGMLAAMKLRGLVVYDSVAVGGSAALRTHGEGRHRGPGVGSLRAAVFGMNDGLLSNASLLLGVAGAGANSTALLTSGIAGLLAGAFSMAAGEYVSVRAQREMFEYQMRLEREELAEYPEEEAAELALIYEARGMPPDQAKAFSDSLIADPVRALDALAREELGLNPDDLGSPRIAATSSFAAFALGALIPLVPFFLPISLSARLGACIGVTALTLFAVGATLSLFTGRGAFRGGARMVLIGAAAGVITFGIGKLLGVTLS
jgi:vacuolar iron transporter family protein